MEPARGLAAITGASSGIGAAFAHALAARGSDLILIARRTDRLEALAQELSGRYGAKCDILTADLSVDADLERVAQKLAVSEQLDLLVNNAGFGAGGTFFGVDVRPQMGMHRVHVLATLRLMHAVLAGMVERGKGGVINVASVAGFLTTPGSAGYGSSKSWINTFTEAVWMELRAAGSPVGMQALCPGFTYSEFHDVAGLDRDKMAPKAWWYPAEFVVAESLAGLERDQVFVIPGFRYRMVVRLMGMVPRGLRRRILLAVAKQTGRLAAK